MKSEHYVAAVTAAYRRELDRYYASPADYRPQDVSMQQLERITYRPYTTGFFFGNPGIEGQNVEKAEYIKGWDYIAKVIEPTGDEKRAWVEEFNPFTLGDRVEVLHPSGDYHLVTILDILDENGEQVERVKHPRQRVLVTFDRAVERLSILRKQRD